MDKTELLVTCGLISLILFGLGLHGYGRQRAMVHPVLLHGEEGGANLESALEPRQATAELRIARPASRSEKQDINRASAADLRVAHGIGESISQSIVDYRNENGAFANMEDVLNVPGVGPARLKEIARYFIVPSAVPAVSQAQDPHKKTGEKAPAASGRININTAGAGELEKLPGIGPVLAQQIVDYRRDHAYFRSKNGLLSVPGIGEGRLSSIWKHIEVSPGLDYGQSLDARPSKPMPRVVNINLASEREIMTLPGIGEAYARRIVEDRKRRGAFKSVADLQRVNGIGPKRLEQIREMVYVD